MYTTTTSTPRPTTTYAAEASEVDSLAYYNQQQIDRLGHEYEYYEYDSNDDTEEAKEPEEQEYEYYYTYSYEYVDPDQLQYERLPRPSFQGGKSKKEEWSAIIVPICDALMCSTDRYRYILAVLK